MFHMTNDSDKFRTAAELERMGAYRVAGQRWERGAERWLPLMVGRWPPSGAWSCCAANAWYWEVVAKR